MLESFHKSEIFDGKMMKKIVKTFYEYFRCALIKKMLIQVCGFEKTELKLKIARLNTPTYKRNLFLPLSRFFALNIFSLSEAYEAVASFCDE